MEFRVGNLNYRAPAPSPAFSPPAEPPESGGRPKTSCYTAVTYCSCDAGGTNKDWIDAVYKLLLGRTADANGESYWQARLAAGETRLKVAQGIAASTENNTQLINHDYFRYLGRAADPGGLAYWLRQFADGKTNEDVIAGFTGAAEYYKEKTS